MKRPVMTWLIFGLCLGVLIAAMGWITRLALQLDRAEVEALRQAALQERIRLALWRMDSALAPLIAQESARPYFQYSPFYPAEQAYGRMFAAVAPGQVLLPSPLLNAPVPNVLLHFQSDPAGKLSSPEVPTGDFRRLARRTGIENQQIALFAERIKKLETIPRNVMLAQLPGSRPTQPAAVRLPEPEAKKQAFSAEAPAKASETQAALSDKEFEARTNQQITLNRNFYAQNALAPQLSTPAPQPPPLDVQNAAQTILVNDGPMQAVWYGDALILARRVWVDKTEYVQGCWLDWPALCDSLLRSVGDLLPQARLQPMAGGGSASPGLRLAALPVQLVPGTVDAETVRPASLLKTSLAVAWVGVLVAALAAGVLLHKAVSLSERRGAFVSAVTHELRTPLTTFLLYTEMLAEGMVPDEAKRRDFVRVLRREAERLDHLVRNVLAYSRLERNRPSVTFERGRTQDLLGRCSERVVSRAQEAGLSLNIDITTEVQELEIRTDVSAVEQILFNLVDNAAKYAVSAPDALVEITAARSGRHLVIAVRDHGPGIPEDVRKRLFRPFSKSAVQAARSAPGVGLGLALSRRLARSLGGDLSLDTSITPGARFLLRLPL